MRSRPRRWCKGAREHTTPVPARSRTQVMYDTSEFVQTSIEEVVQTFVEALILVLIVVFLFLQSWRATLIPMLAVPVSLVHVRGIQLLGFSINTLSLFGMVLAIGIVVDDAIVVVEAVEHNMQTYELSPKDATREAMDEVRGPVIAIALVLVGGLHPDGIHPGRHRAAVQAVRGDRRGLDDVLGAGRLDPDAGAVRDAAQAARTRSASRRTAGGFLRALQPSLRPHQPPYGRAAGHGARRVLGCSAPRRGGPRHRRAAEVHADRVRPGRGQGRRVHAGDPARRGGAGAHDRGRAQGAADRAAAPGCRSRNHRRRFRPDLGHVSLECARSSSCG